MHDSPVLCFVRSKVLHTVYGSSPTVVSQRLAAASCHPLCSWDPTGTTHSGPTRCHREQKAPHEGSWVQGHLLMGKAVSLHAVRALLANHTPSNTFQIQRNIETELSSASLVPISETPPYGHASCSPQPDFIHTVSLYKRQGSGFQKTQLRPSVQGGQSLSAAGGAQSLPPCRAELFAPGPAGLCPAFDFKNVSWGVSGWRWW